MDEDRKIRFMISPILFFASLGWGMLWDPYYRAWLLSVIMHQHNQSDTAAEVIGSSLASAVALLAGGGIALFTCGYIIGTITYLALRAYFSCGLFGCQSRCHEIAFSDETLSVIWSKLDAPGPWDRKKELFAGVALDHGLVQKEFPQVHQWSVRRWHAFSIAATSVTGLLLSLIVGFLVFHFQCLTVWWLPITVFAAMLFISAKLAWRETMDMLAFLAQLPKIDLRDHMENATKQQPTISQSHESLKLPIAPGEQRN